MGEPTWRQIKQVLVPEQPGCAWTPAVDVLTAGKLYRVRVQPKPGANGQAATQSWTPESLKECSADGSVETAARTDAIIMPDARMGSLIGKIGGGTADATTDATKLVLLAIGRHCVFQAPDATKTGPLYLGMNDTLKAMPRVGGQLEVVIDEAL